MYDYKNKNKKTKKKGKLKPALFPVYGLFHVKRPNVFYIWAAFHHADSFAYVAGLGYDTD